MAITGKEAFYKSLLITNIEAGIAADCSAIPIAPNCISGLADGIAMSLIPFLTSDADVLPLGLLDSVGGPVTGLGKIG